MKNFKTIFFALLCVSLISCSNDDDSNQLPNAVVNLKINNIVIPFDNIDVYKLDDYISVNAWNGEIGFEEEDLLFSFYINDLSNDAVGFAYYDIEAVYPWEGDFETNLTTSTANQSTGEFSGSIVGLIEADLDLNNPNILTTENYFEISFEVNY